LNLINVPEINNSFTASYLTTSSFDNETGSFVKNEQTASMTVGTASIWIDSVYYTATTSFHSFTESVITRVIPAGGTVGQVLSKSTNSDFAMEWTTPSSTGGITTLDQTYIAGENISALKVVRVGDSGNVFTANNINTSSAHKIVGVSVNSAILNETLTVRHTGTLTDVVWNWIIGSPIFFDNNGILTQTPPSSGFLQQVAIPKTTTTIILKLGEVIII